MDKKIKLDWTLNIRLVELHDKIANSRPGMRQHTLYRAARELGTLVADDKLPTEVAKITLDHAAGCCGLTFTDGQGKVDALIAAAFEHARREFPWDIE